MRFDRKAAVQQSHQVGGGKPILHFVALAVRAYRGKENDSAHNEATYTWRAAATIGESSMRA